MGHRQRRTLYAALELGSKLVESLPWSYSGAFSPKALVLTGAKIIDQVVHYCLCQRIKPFGTDPMFASVEAYTRALQAHHDVMTAAMRAKHTVNPSACDELDAAVEHFAPMYLPAPAASL